MSFIEVGHFECFDASIIMRDRGEEYGWWAIFELCCNMRNQSSYFGLDIVRSSNFSTFIFEKI